MPFAKKTYDRCSGKMRKPRTKMRDSKPGDDYTWDRCSKTWRLKKTDGARRPKRQAGEEDYIWNATSRSYQPRKKAKATRRPKKPEGDVVWRGGEW